MDRFTPEERATLEDPQWWRKIVMSLSARDSSLLMDYIEVLEEIRDGLTDAVNAQETVYLKQVERRKAAREAELAWHDEGQCNE